MKKTKRRNGRRLLAGLLILCMLPLGDFSGFSRVKALEGKENAEQETEGPVTTIEPSETAEPSGTIKPSETAEPEEISESAQPVSAEEPEETQELILTSILEEGSVVLRWNRLPCEEGETITYAVYRNESLLEITEEDSYTDALPEAGESRIYQIRASRRDGDGVLAESNCLELNGEEDWQVDRPFQLEHDMTVGSLVVGADLHLNGYHLTVNGDVVINEGYLFPETGFLECRGDFTATGDGGCFMTQEEDRVLVCGDMVTEWNNYQLENGILELKGNFNVSNETSISLGKPIRILLSGDRLQKISAGKNLLGIVELQNDSEEGVMLDKVVRAVEFHSNGCRVTFEKEESYRLGWTLEEDQTIEGDLKLFGDTLDLAGHTLTVKGNLIQSGGTVKINGGALLIEGDYRLESDEGVCQYNGDNFGKLVMQREEDYVRVEEKFSISSAAGTAGLLTAGILECKGDLYKYSAYYMEEGADNFYASGEHTVLLSGKGNHVNAYDYHGFTFQNLELGNESDESLDLGTGSRARGVVKTNGKKVRGEIEVINSSQIEGGSYPGSLIVTGEIRDLEVKGSLHVKGEAVLTGRIVAEGDFINEGAYEAGNCPIEGGNVLVKGDYYNWTCSGDAAVPVMSGEESRLEVEGSYIQSGSKLLWTAGTLEIKGDLELNTGEFIASGGHKVLLSGERGQNIINRGGRLELHILELKNPIGVNVAGRIKIEELIQNKTKFTYGGEECIPGQILKEDLVIEDDIALIEDLDLNGHSLTIHGDLLHMGGELWLHGGRLTVEGDYRQQTVIRDGENVSYENCQSSLVMQDKRDFFRIGGSFFISTKEDDGERLTRGEIQLEGDLAVAEGCALNTGGEHRLILKGTGKQRLLSNNFGMPSGIRHLVIENSSSEGVEVLKPDLLVTGSVENRRSKVTGILPVSPGAEIVGSYHGNILLAAAGNVKSDWDIDGNLTIDQQTSISGTVTVRKDLDMGKSRLLTLTLNRGRLLVKGDARFSYISGSNYYHPTVQMTHDEDYFGVEGKLSVSSPWRFTLTAGVLELKGDLYAETGGGMLLTMSGTHKLVLSGNQKQTMDLDYSCARIHTLELKNESEEGVYFTGQAPIDELITNGCHISYKNQEGVFGWTLQEDQVIEGNLYLLGGTLDLNGHELTIQGNLVQADGDIYVNQGKLTVEKDYRVQEWEGNESYSSGNGRLSMGSPEDYVLIQGNYVNESRMSGIITNGTFEIQGDFYKIGYGEDWGAYDKATVLLSGDKNQKIWSKDRHIYLSRLEIKNRAGGCVEFGKGVTVEDSLRTNGTRITGTPAVYGDTLLDEVVNGNLVMSGGGTMQKDLEVLGDLTVTGEFTLKADVKVHGSVVIQDGCLNMKAGSLLIGKDLNVLKNTDEREEYALKMTDEAKLLRVEGNYLNRSRRITLLEKGSLQVKGNVQFLGLSSVEQKEGHEWILNGDRKQTFEIENLKNRIFCLKIQNTSSEGVDITRPVRIGTLISNGCRVTYGGTEGKTGWTLEKDQSIEGDLKLVGGVLDLNGHTLTINGNLNHLAGTIRIHGGRLVIEKDYHLQNILTDGIDRESLGILEMSEKKDWVAVKGKMTVYSYKEAVSRLMGGTLELRKGLKKQNTEDTFLCGGTHTILLSGKEYCPLSMYRTKIQNLVNRSGYPGIQGELTVKGTLWDEAQSFSPDAVIRMKDPNRLEEEGLSGSLKLEKALTSTRDLKVKGTLYGKADWNLNGHTAAVGRLEAESGELTLGGGRLECDTARFAGSSRLRMEKPEDRVRAGEFSYTSGEKPVLIAGTLEIRESFTDNSPCGFRAGGEHRVILNPCGRKPNEAVKPRVTFERKETEHGFHTLILYRPKGEYTFSHAVETLCDELVYEIHGKEWLRKVTGLRAEKAEVTAITLAWEPSSGKAEVAGYEIRRDGAKAGVSGECRYEDTGLTPGRSYRYTVYALDGEGNRSEVSEELLAGTREDREAPEVPGDVTVRTRTGSSVTLGWNPSRDNVKTTGYHIYRNGKRIETGWTGVVYQDREARRDGTNVYEVSAVDAAGNESERSAKRTAVVAGPRILEVTPGDRARFGGEEKELSVRFQDVGNSQGNTVMIEREIGEGSWERLTETPLKQKKSRYGELRASFRWDIRGIREQAEQTVRYTVTDADGNQDRRTVTYRIDRKAPVAPRELEAVTENGVVRLCWSPSISADCAGYTVYRKPEGEKEEYQKLSRVEGRFETAWTDREAAAGKTYVYQVTASDDFNQESEPSGSVSVTVETDREAPEVTGLLPGEGRVTGVVTLTADAEDNLGVRSIRLWVHGRGEEWKEIGTNGSQTEEKKGRVTAAWDTAAWEGACEVRAVAADAAGNESEPLIRRYEADHRGPGAVKPREAKTGDTWVQLRWEDTAEPDFGWFTVEQKKNGAWEKESEVWEELGETVNGLTPDTGYCFRVVGYDDLGNRGTPSEEIRVRTKADTAPPVLRRVSPNGSYYKGTMELSMLVEDNWGGGRGRFSWSYDRESWEVIRELEAGEREKETEYRTEWETDDKREGPVYVRFEAWDKAGLKNAEPEGPICVEYRIDRTAPAQVKDLEAKGKEGLASLRWKAGGEKDLAGYRIYRSEGETGEYRVLETAWKGAGYSDRKVKPGGIYRYQVSALDLAGNAGPRSETALVQVTADTRAPQILGMSPSENGTAGANPKMTIWAADNSNLGKVLAWYRKAGDEGAIWEPFLEERIGGTNRLCEGVLPTEGLPEGEYEWKAYVEDAAGNRSEPAIGSFRLDLTAPGAPKLYVKRGGRKLTLQWEANREEDFAYYELYRQSAYESAPVKLRRLEETGYEDGQVRPETVYTYRLKCVDQNGNASWTREASGAASAEDTEPPAACVPEEVVGIEGMELALDGTASHDNVGIEKYRWELGNGKEKSGVQPLCIYEKAGIYLARLTVYDAAGNQAEAQTRVTILPADRAGTVTVRVTDTAGRALRHAYVYVKLSEGERRNLRTDAEGRVSVSGAPGAYQVAAYQEGYLPREERLEIHSYQTEEQNIRLEAGEAAVGKLEVRRLELEEMEEAGIDFQDPENYHTYVFQVEMQFEQEPIPTYQEYLYVGGTGEVTPWNGGKEENPEKPEGGVSDVQLTVYQGEKSPEGEEEEAVPILAYLRTPQREIRWLKDLYAVELGIVNEAEPEFVIEGARAELKLPEGVSLAGTLAGQETERELGSIAGGEQKKAVWYVRADRAGSYELRAGMEGVLEPFGAKVRMECRTEKDLEAGAGKGLHLYLRPEDSAHIGKEYYVQFLLRNESEEAFYHLKAKLGSYQDPGYEQEITVTDKETGEVWKEGGKGPACLEAETVEACEELPVLRGGDEVTLKVFEPGQELYGTYSTVFEAEGDPEEVYYRLTETLVEEIKGANLGIEVSVEPVSSHIQKYKVELYTIDERLWADPVDVATGAFLEEYEALSVTGGTTVSLELRHNSRETGESGELGTGWSHSYETKIKEEGGRLRLQETPSRETMFVPERAVRRELAGTVVDGRILLEAERDGGEETYMSLSEGMEGYRLTRKADGTYEGRGPEGEKYAFDSQGRLTRLKSVEGGEVKLTRGKGSLEVTDVPSGRYLRLTYDEEGRVKQVEDASGRSTRFTYEDGRLVRITNPLGESTEYGYDEGGRIRTASSSGIVYVTNRYDEKGRVRSQKDGEGKETEFWYEEKRYGGQITHVRDRNGGELCTETDRRGNLVRTVDQTGAEQSASYDGRGHLLSERDGEGNVVYYETDEAGLIREVKDAGFHTTRYEYDEKGNVTRLAGEGGREARYAYDEAGRLKKAEGSGGEITEYGYDGFGRLIWEKKEGEGTKKYRYENGQLSEETDRRGNQSISKYDSRGNLTENRDRTGAVTRYEYDALNRPVRVTDGSGGVTEYQYDGRGNIKEKRVAGERTRYRYDGNSRLIREERPDGSFVTYGYDGEGRLTRVTGPDGRGKETKYDKAGRALEETNEAGERTRYTYDKAGCLTSETGPDGETTRYAYYPNGKRYTAVYPDGRRELYTYDPNWQLLVVTDGMRSVSYEYDASGHVTAERDGEGNTRRYEYDRNGNLLKETDANGGETAYEYDANGNCVKRKDALGFVTEYAYDGENRLTAVEARTKAGKLRREYRYDACGRLTETLDEEGNRRKRMYDRQGRVVEERDALGQRTAAYTYDALGRLTRETSASGQETAYGYDKGDRLTRVTEQGGGEEPVEWRREYDAAGRVTEARDPEKGESRASYDKAGRVTELSNPGGGTTRYGYDRMGRIIRVEVEGSGAVTYAYGKTGLLKERKNGRGQSARYEYDRAGRVSACRDESGEVRYTYDGNGNLLTVTDETGTITREYDALNRVTKYTDRQGRSVGYGYDELGNLLTLTYPGGEIVRYTYDKTGNLLTVTDWKGRVTRYTYDGNGRLQKTERADGTEETREYDASGRLTRQTDRKGRRVLRDARYTYDASGNLTEIRGETGDGSALGEAAEMTYDGNNRLLTWNGEKVRYDREGNLTYGPLDGRLCGMEYDSRNRLIRAGETRYEYDAENVRTAVLEKGRRTELVTDPEAALPRVLLALERREGKEPEETTRYVYGNGLLSEESGARGYLTYHYDQVGSTVLLTNEKGEEKRSFSYGPYGESPEGDREGIRFLYNGRYGVETDGNGLLYMRARYYNAELRRFLNRDVEEGTLTDSASLNRYAYVQGNPVSWTDPYGLSPLSDPGWIGHSLLGLLGCVPGAGEIADGVNAIWYFVEGDTSNGWMSLGAALPGIGALAGSGLKLVFGSGGRVASLAKLVQGGSRVVGHGLTLWQAGGRLIENAQGMYEKYYVRGEKAGFDTALETGVVLLDVVTCLVSGKSLMNEVQGACQAARNAGRELTDGFRKRTVNEGGSKYDLYRKEFNTGTYKDLEELMQLKNVKNVANKAGVGLDGIKVKIDRNPELLGRTVYGYTDGKTITLYPDAFTNTETLVRTLGHERTHVYQVGVFGKPTSTDILGEFERGASMSEQSWWDYFNFRNGGQ